MVISSEDIARWRVKVIINYEYGSKKELKEIAKIAAEFEKEYSCDCTLNVKVDPYSGSYNQRFGIDECEKIGERILKGDK